MFLYSGLFSEETVKEEEKIGFDFKSDYDSIVIENNSL